MILYHGTNVDIENIDLSKGLRFKDFGKGFYVTPNRSTAIRLAKKKARLFGGEATLITYELDETVLNSEIRIKVFPKKACVEWLEFIAANRDRKVGNTLPKYDLVIGPIADDGVVLQLTNYREGIYSSEDVARMLQDRFLDQQYCFRTEKALLFLHKSRVEIL